MAPPIVSMATLETTLSTRVRESTRLLLGPENNTFVINNSSDVIVDHILWRLEFGAIFGEFHTAYKRRHLDAFTGSANLTGVGNADSSNVLTANSGNDVLIGEAGATTINGGSGADTLYAGPGTNVINSGNGGTSLNPTDVFGNLTGTSASTQSTIYGGTGFNNLYGGPGSDAIYAGSGTSSLISGIGADTLFGSASGQTLLDTLSGNAVLVAGAGSETLEGTGADQLVAGSGNDEFIGSGTGGLTYELNSGFGQDSILVVAGDTTTVDNLVFGPGIEPSAVTISAASPGGVPDALQFSTGTSSVVVENALLPGIVGSVTFADTGTESLAQLINADGPGAQTLGGIILSTGNGKNVAGTSVTSAMFGYGDNDTLAAFPDNPFTTTQTTQIYAYGNNNVLSAGLAADTINAYGNADVITDPGDYVSAFGANDTIKASTGFSNAYIDVYQSSTVVQASVGTTDITLNSFASYTLPSNIQTLVLQGSGLIGTSNAQGGSLTAAGNNDTLIGTTGNDTLSAGNGLFDSLVGGSGADRFVVGSATDTIVAGANPGLDTIDSSVNYSLPTGINNLIADGSQIVVTGNGANDVLSMGTGGEQDTIIAGSGNDTLNARFAGEVATLVGGSGTDAFIVTNSGDEVQESSAGTNSVIESSVSFSLPTNVNILELNGSGSEVGTGNAGNDLIVRG